MTPNMGQAMPLLPRQISELVHERSIAAGPERHFYRLGPAESRFPGSVGLVLGWPEVPSDLLHKILNYGLTVPASEPIGSQAGSTMGGSSSAARRAAGRALRRAAISNRYSSNHESFMR